MAVFAFSNASPDRHATSAFADFSPGLNPGSFGRASFADAASGNESTIVAQYVPQKWCLSQPSARTFMTLLLLLLDLRFVKPVVPVRRALVPVEVVVLDDTSRGSRRPAYGRFRLEGDPDGSVLPTRLRDHGSSPSRSCARDGCAGCATSRARSPGRLHARSGG